MMIMIRIFNEAEVKEKAVTKEIIEEEMKITEVEGIEIEEKEINYSEEEMSFTEVEEKTQKEGKVATFEEKRIIEKTCEEEVEEVEEEEIILV
jgi:hypothetical protein